MRSDLEEKTLCMVASLEQLNIERSNTDVLKQEISEMEDNLRTTITTLNNQLEEKDKIIEYLKQFVSKLGNKTMNIAQELRNKDYLFSSRSREILTDNVDKECLLSELTQAQTENEQLIEFITNIKQICDENTTCSISIHNKAILQDILKYINTDEFDCTNLDDKKKKKRASVSKTCECNFVSEDINDLRTQLRKSSEKIAQLQKDNHCLQRSSKNEERLDVENKALRRHSMDMQDAAKEKISELTSDLREALEQCSILKMENQLLQDMSKSIQEQICCLNKDLERNSASKAKVDDINEQLEKALEQISILQNENCTLHSLARSLQEQMNDNCVNSRYAELEKQLDETTREMQDLLEKNEALNDELERIKSNVAILTSTTEYPVEQFCKMAEQFDEEMQILKQENVKLKETIRDLTRTITKCEQEYEQQLNKKASRNVTLQKYVDHLEDCLCSKDNHIQKLSRERMKLNKNINNLEEHIHHLEDKIEDTLIAFTGNVNSIGTSTQCNNYIEQTIEEKCACLENENVRLKHLLDKLHEDKEKYLCQINCLEKQIGSLQTQITSRRMTICSSCSQQIESYTEESMLREKSSFYTEGIMSKAKSEPDINSTIFISSVYSVEAKSCRSENSLSIFGVTKEDKKSESLKTSIVASQKTEKSVAKVVSLIEQKTDTNFSSSQDSKSETKIIIPSSASTQKLTVPSKKKYSSQSKRRSASESVSVDSTTEDDSKKSSRSKSESRKFESRASSIHKRSSRGSRQLPKSHEVDNISAKLKEHESCEQKITILEELVRKLEEEKKNHEKLNAELDNKLRRVSAQATELENQLLKERSRLATADSSKDEEIEGLRKQVKALRSSLNIAEENAQKETEANLLLHKIIKEMEDKTKKIIESAQPTPVVETVNTKEVDECTELIKSLQEQVTLLSDQNKALEKKLSSGTFLKLIIYISVFRTSKIIQLYLNPTRF